MQPRITDGKFVAETHLFKFEVGTIFNPTIRETLIVDPEERLCAHHARLIGDLAFSSPSIDNSCSLVPDVVATFELHTLIVVDVITQRVFEIDIEGEALVVQSGEDVTIKIGIRITNLHTVGFVDPTISILVYEMHIACTEIARGMRGESSGIFQPCSLCFFGCSKDACSFVAIENTCSFTDHSEDVVLAIDGTGVTFHNLLSHFMSFVIEFIRANDVVFRFWKFGDLVLIVSYTETKIPFEILMVDENCIDIETCSYVAEFTIVAPLAFHTCDVTHIATREEVCGQRAEHFCTYRKTIMEHIELQTSIQTMGGFPLNFGVLNVGQLQRSGTIQELDVFEVSARCIVIDSIVTTGFITCGEAGIVNEVDFEPVFVADYPTCLQRGEESPLHTCNLDAALSLFTET